LQISNINNQLKDRISKEPLGKDLNKNICNNYPLKLRKRKMLYKNKKRDKHILINLKFKELYKTKRELLKSNPLKIKLLMRKTKF
jgi:hypothetical protein